MGRYSGKACRLLSMLSLTASFFLVEIIVGYVTNSIALVADSFHMLSDVVALIVGFASVRISKWKSPKNTFGWARAEVLGALVNAVFLIALCFSITIEALKRLIQVEEIENPKLMLIVGGAGLAINLVGLCLFHNHGHSHGGGGHGHSHGGGGQGHKSHNDQSENNIGHGPETDALVETRNLTNGSTVRNHDSNSCDIEIEDADILVEVNTEPGRKVSSSSQLNMRGVFLHVLGDALGSVIVVISALLIWFIEADWKYYVDPAMSLFMVVIIVSTTIPLLKESSFILLQTVPGHIIVSDIKEKLAKIPGVIAVHELHVWQLAGSKLIASVHVQCGSMSDYTTNIAQKIKDTFHEEGIHSSTIQPEIIDEEAYSSTCALECGPDKHCYQDTCCAERVKKPNGSRGDSPANKNGSAKNTPPITSTDYSQRQQV